MAERGAVLPRRPAGGLGERVAAGLRELLRDPARAPVLVLATLWPQFWDVLTARPRGGQPDPHAQARELLAGRDISVPAAFTAAQLRNSPGQQTRGWPGPPKRRKTGRSSSSWPGRPELLARYRNAPPAAAALISAAIDARRMGMGIALPLAFLEAAAPGYLTDTDWDGLGEDWLEQALAYTAAPCKGIRGPLTRIRPRTTAQASGPAYRLADYLDQHGRRARRGQYPPVEFWAAWPASPSPPPSAPSPRPPRIAACCVTPPGCASTPTAYGDAIQAQLLIQRMYSLRPADHSPAQWAAAHAASKTRPPSPSCWPPCGGRAWSSRLSDLLARNPAAHVLVEHPGGVGELLKLLREAGADQQVTDLATRAAAHALYTPYNAVTLLRAMRRAGAEQQAADLAARNGNVNPQAVAELLRSCGMQSGKTRLPSYSTAIPPHAPPWPIRTTSPTRPPSRDC